MLKKKTTVLWNCRTSYNYLTDDFCFSHPSSPPICSFSVGVTWVTGPHWFPLLRLSRESGWRFSEPSSCQTWGPWRSSSRRHFSWTVLGQKTKNMMALLPRHRRDRFEILHGSWGGYLLILILKIYRRLLRRWVNGPSWFYLESGKSAPLAPASLSSSLSPPIFFANVGPVIAIMHDTAVTFIFFFFFCPMQLVK